MPKVHGKQIQDGTVTSTQGEMATGTISTINAGDTAVTGTSIGLAHKDHQHAVATGAATSSIDVGDTAAEGTSTNLAREDHQHALASPTAPVDVTKAAAATGSAATVARSDHKHDVSTAAAVELTDSTNAEGAATSLARSNHTHSHGSRGGGALHAVATTGVAGFMSSTDKTKIDALVTPNILSPKDSVRLLSTGDVTLSGNQSVDGITTAPGQRVALFSQATGTQNGIYDTNAGTWTRTADFALGSGQAGAVFTVEDGNTRADTLWLVTNNSGSDVVGTDVLTVGQIGVGNKTSNQEVVTTQNITNTDTALTDTLNATPSPAASLSLYLNGVFQQQGAGFDYTVSGTTITWLALTGTAVDMTTADSLVATYLS